MKRFQRTVEDFTCEHCGTDVKGDGYTNHCIKCLWSKHVDINPGDRAHRCGGLMKPVRTEGTAAKYFIIHRCVKCGTEEKNIFGEKDSTGALLAIAKDAAEGIIKKRAG